MLFWQLLSATASISALNPCQSKGLMECPIPKDTSRKSTLCGQNTVACPTKNHSCYAVVIENKLNEGGCLRNADNQRAVMHTNGSFTYEKTYFTWANPCQVSNITGEYEIEYSERIFGKIYKICCNQHCAEKNPLQWGMFGKKIDAIFVGIMLAICFFGITIEKVIGRYRKYQAKCLVLRNMKKYK